MKTYANKQALNDEVLKDVAGGQPDGQGWRPGDGCKRCGSEVAADYEYRRYYCTKEGCGWTIEFSEVD